ncbi:MAG: V-type ATP synthase subunit D [Candidatus Hadarchaeales archaeon]
MAMPSATSQTRMELINLRKKLVLAQRGKDLLQEKMDALVMEFFYIAREVTYAKKVAFKSLEEAHRLLTVCLGVNGTLETLQHMREVRKDFKVEISSKLIMGVETPLVTVHAREKKVTERGYGLYTSNPLLDKVAEKFEETLKYLCKLAELESSLLAIAEELEKTKRRVNALEHVIIPEVRETIRMIEMKLGEIERDNFVRLKRMKTLRERR